MNLEVGKISLENDSNVSIGARSIQGLKCITGDGSSIVNDFEPRLAKAILDDDKAELHLLWPPLTTSLRNGEQASVKERAVVTKLLHVCCAFDAVKCATSVLNGELGPAPLLNEVDGAAGMSPLHKAAAANAARCVEMLVSKRARTDQRTRDGYRLLPLELSLSRIRNDVTWNPDQQSVEDLVVQLSEKDLKAFVLLCENTKEIDDVVYKSAMGAHVVDLAVLLVAAAGRGNKLAFTDPNSSHKATIYECVIQEAIACGRPGTSSSLVTTKHSCELSESESSGKRKLLLTIVKLLQLFGLVGVHTNTTGSKMAPPLIVRASKVGDEDVLDLLLKHTDVNVTDEDGNSALHWCLRTCKGLCPQRMKIMSLLLNHGARANQKNNWGLTAVHFAAENGNSQAIQELLSKEPACINKKTEMKETPLYFAVKNDHKECVELLLRYGASTNILNLRKQRPIDLAESQDMRFLLSQTHIIPKNRPFLVQQKFTAQLQGVKGKSQTWEEVNISLNKERAMNSKNGWPKEAEICKYYDSVSGCARGDKCFYLHGEEFQRTKPAACRTDETLLGWNHVRRIFVGGLHRDLNSDSLQKVFEERFGSVQDARVIIGTQNGGMSQSRGFGFVTFKDKKSFVAAVEARHIAIMGKQVEIKSVVPKHLLLAEFQESLQQRAQQSDPRHAQAENPKQNTTMEIPGFSMLIETKETQDNDTIRKQVTSNKTEEERTDYNVREEEEEEATLLKSWVDILRRGREKQPVSSLSQYPKQFMPLWLGVFRKWLPSFLRQVSSRTEEYALSSLKSDFRAAFGMDLDHLSLGYSKLANFIRCFPDLCQLEFIAIGKGKPRNHMILLPVLSEPTRRLFQSPTLPSSSSHHNSDNNAPVQEGICDDDESTEDHLPEVSSQNDESADTCINVGRNVNLDLHGDLASGHSWFIEFLKPDPMFQGRTWLQNALLQPRPEWKHMVLEFASREKNNHHQSTFFLREYDYYEVRE
ncbi:26S proteasome non-ATPase regulatory subunit 10 [Linum perenne]